MPNYESKSNVKAKLCNAQNENAKLPCGSSLFHYLSKAESDAIRTYINYKLARLSNGSKSTNFRSLTMDLEASERARSCSFPRVTQFRNGRKVLFPSCLSRKRRRERQERKRPPFITVRRKYVHSLLYFRKTLKDWYERC